MAHKNESAAEVVGLAPQQRAPRRPLVSSNPQAGGNMSPDEIISAKRARNNHNSSSTARPPDPLANSATLQRRSNLSSPEGEEVEAPDTRDSSASQGVAMRKGVHVTPELSGSEAMRAHLAEQERMRMTSVMAAVGSSSSRPAPSAGARVVRQGVGSGATDAFGLPKSEETEGRKQVQFKADDDNEVFQPSYETFTPRVDNSVKYRRPEQRETEALAPGGSLQKPNFDDAMRRVAVVIYQHIARCEARYEMCTPELEEIGLFHVSRMNEFAEDNFVQPQFRYKFMRLPLARPGVSYSMQKVRKTYDVPSAEEIYQFMRRLFVKAQLSSECSIVCLVYVEKLMEIANVPLVRTTWRPVLLCGLLLASKVWQDLSSWNVEFASVYPQFSLQHINRLERTFLQCIKWDLYISGSEYAKYYFALRSMTEKRDFRRRYNYMMQVNPPQAKHIASRTEAAKNVLLSTSL